MGTPLGCSTTTTFRQFLWSFSHVHRLMLWLEDDSATTRIAVRKCFNNEELNEIDIDQLRAVLFLMRENRDKILQILSWLKCTSERWGKDVEAIFAEVQERINRCVNPN